MKRFFLRIGCLIFLVGACCLFGVTASFAQAAPAQPVTTPAKKPSTSLAPNTTAVKPTVTPDKRMWNLQDADIRAVIDAVSKETGKNFIIDPRVQGKITIVSSKSMSADELYQVFLSTLQVLGYAAVPSGDVIKIVPNSNARSLSAPLVNGNQSAQGDEFVVKVINVKNISASQLVPILQPLVPDWSFVSAYTPTNSLMLAGEANNVNRLTNIVNHLDTQADSQTKVVPLRYASANKVLNVLNSLQSADRATGKVLNVALAADKQANSIVLSGNADDLTRMTQVIHQLDIPGSGDTGVTRVFYLNYLDAKTLAPILAKIAHSSYAQTGDNIGTSNIAKSGTTLPAINAALPNSAADTSDNDDTNTNQQVSIEAEPASNAVVVSAPPALMANLASVIRQLDVQPRQVLVEAIIAQVDERLIRSLGITWNTPIPSSGDLPEGTIGFITRGNLQGVIAALSTDNAADILSTPSIVVLDNKKAKIEVGQIVPIANRQYATTDTGSNNSSDAGVPYTTYEQRKVVLKLTVTPQISPNQLIRLKIEQGNDSLQNPDNPGPLPIINTSNIDTDIMVKSGGIIVLGGLISHNLNDTVRRIPLLGDVPIFGNLFKYRSKEVDKRNLLVFLRPVILEQGAQINNITTDRYNNVRQDQLLRRSGQNVLTPKETPLLPPLEKPKVKLPSPF